MSGNLALGLPSCVTGGEEGSPRTERTGLSQAKEDESTMTPPIVVPCPPIHLVAEATMMCAPSCKGLQVYPAMPKVLSTTIGISYWSASVLSAAKSGI